MNYLELAYKEAEKAYLKNEVPVGAILIKEDQLIASGHNLRITKNNSLYHAEIIVIEEACKILDNWRLDDSILYVTLEPCLMCAGAIMQSRISKVVFGALDAKGGAVVSQYQVFDDGKLPFKVQYEYVPHQLSSKILSDFFREKRFTEISE